jgi:hypothetical protein
LESKKDQKNHKKPYQKPLLLTIELETDQVLGVGCKLATAGADYGDPATCIGNFCAEAGS